MEHTEAREMLSARLDDEVASSVALDEHLASCDACRAFETGALRLRALTEALPRETVAVTWRAPVRARAFRIAPALAAAVVVAVVLAVLGPPGSFVVPIPAAAEPLTAIRTLYVEREIVNEQTHAVTHEKIWFRSPGSVRIERYGTAGNELIIETPGRRYESNASGATLTARRAPDANVLPEPLSPTIALLGVPKGAGPEIDGRPTVRYDLTFNNGFVRTAYVDTSYTAIGIDESIILQKVAPQGAEGGTKRVTALQVNQPIDDAMFAIPSIPVARDEGFRARSLDAMTLAPVALPEGFHLVASGRDVEGTDTMLFARGAFPIQVVVGARAGGIGPTSRSQTIRIGRVDAQVVYDLYALPFISFTLQNRIVTITAPMDADGLAALARTMFAL